MRCRTFPVERLQLSEIRHGYTGESPPLLITVQQQHGGGEPHIQAADQVFVEFIGLVVTEIHGMSTVQQNTDIISVQQRRNSVVFDTFRKKADPGAAEFFKFTAGFAIVIECENIPVNPAPLRHHECREFTNIHRIIGETPDVDGLQGSGKAPALPEVCLPLPRRIVRHDVRQFRRHSPVPAEKLTTIFSNKDFITPKALTSEHRSKLIKYIIKPGHSVGFSFLLERVMQESLTIGQRRELTEMINSITGKLTAIEAAAVKICLILLLSKFFGIEKTSTG